jgi:hypothetical protein
LGTSALDNVSRSAALSRVILNPHTFLRQFLKSITTVIADIYGLFTNPQPFAKKDIEAFGQRLATHVSNRISEERGTPTLRLSNLGAACDRKLWLQINRPETAASLPPATRFKFLYGDILEELVLFLAKVAGHKVSSSQQTVSVNGVKGHIDAILDGHLVDVKSASPYSFNKFKSHGLEADDPFAYRTQLGSYLHACQDDPELKEKDVASFLAVDKTLGHMCLDTHPKNDTDYDALVDQKRTMLAEATPPDRPFTGKAEGKSGNRSLETICSYCDHKFDCWSDANDGKGLRTFLYSTGPRFLTEVIKEPAVIEVNQAGEVVSTKAEGDPF